MHQLYQGKLEKCRGNVKNTPAKTKNSEPARYCYPPPSHSGEVAWITMIQKVGKQAHNTLHPQ